MVRGRGRGGSLHSEGRFGAFNRHRTKLLRPPFDMLLAEQAFPRCNNLHVQDDAQLTQDLLKRNSELAPTPAEQSAVLSLVTRIQAVMDNLIVSGQEQSSVHIQEVRPVGSFKKGTMTLGRNVADLVVILKTLPTKVAVEELCRRVGEELLKIQEKGQENPTLCINERGFGVTTKDASVNCLVSTLLLNMRKFEPELHLSSKLMLYHLAAVRHSRWFEENAHHSSIKVLIRLMRDVCRRHAGLRPLSPWLVDLLAHHCIMNTPNRQPLALAQAFKRALQLLASGIFLPGSTGLTDPCSSVHARAHTTMTLPEQDAASAAAQTLVRVCARGRDARAHVIGLRPHDDGRDVSAEITVWDGVVVSPLTAAFQITDANMADGGDNDDDVNSGTE